MSPSTCRLAESGLERGRARAAEAGLLLKVLLSPHMLVARVLVERSVREAALPSSPSPSSSSMAACRGSTPPAGLGNMGWKELDWSGRELGWQGGGWLSRGLGTSNRCGDFFCLV